MNLFSLYSFSLKDLILKISISWRVSKTLFIKLSGDQFSREEFYCVIINGVRLALRNKFFES